MKLTTLTTRGIFSALIAIALAAAPIAAETRSTVSPSMQELITRGSEPTNPCGALVRECFSYNGQHFERCLHVSAGHPFCDGTALGGLLEKRWQMAPSQPSLDDAPAFLGPKMVNRECGKNFDSQLSALLGSGALNPDVIQSMSQSLSSCSQELPADLLRP